MNEEIERHIQDAVRDNVEASKTTLLKEIGTLFEKISEQNNSSQLSKISNLVSAEQPKFKRNSNEEQFKANSKVLLKLNEAHENLNQENVQEAKSSITEAVEMLSHRQKLIQMADRSDLGWRVVQEYESNPLAVDSEDEKRMYKAKSRANRKMKAEKAKKSKTNRSAPYKRVITLSGGLYAVPTATTQVQRPGLCFQCGKPGHWRKDRPGNNTYNKIIICTDYTENKCLQNISSDIESVKEMIKKSDDKSQDNLPVRYKKSASSIINHSVVGTAPSVSPVGRLKSHASKWRSVSGDSYIVDVIENGYKIPFKVIPPAADLRNNKSARDNPTLVTSEIESLLQKGVISIVERTPLVVNPLTVAYNKVGKPRLVLDCRYINQFLHVFKVKFEDIHVAQYLYETDFYAFTFDLKGAYHHIDIFKAHRTYLGFFW